MASSRDGRRWPRIGDAFDIVRGAVVIRLRLLLKPASGEWSDPLAMVAVFAPILMCLGLSVPSTGLLARAALNHYGITTLILLGLAAAAWPAVLVLSLTGRRGTAIVAAWFLALLGLFILYAVMMEWAELGLLAAIALTWSPGPVRGIAVIGRNRVVAFAAGTAFLGAPWASEWASAGEVRLPAWDWIPVGIAAAIGLSLMCGAAFRIHTADGRRTSILLSLPLAAIAFSLFQAGLFPVSPQRTETVMSAILPVAVFLFFVVVHRRMTRDGGPSSRVSVDGSRPVSSK